MLEEGIPSPIKDPMHIPSKWRNPLRAAAIKIVLKVDEPFSIADRIDGLDRN